MNNSNGSNGKKSDGFYRRATAADLKRVIADAKSGKVSEKVAAKNAIAFFRVGNSNVNPALSDAGVAKEMAAIAAPYLEGLSAASAAHIHVIKSELLDDSDYPWAEKFIAQDLTNYPDQCGTATGGNAHFGSAKKNQEKMRELLHD